MTDLSPKSFDFGIGSAIAGANRTHKDFLIK